jgi:uncharacterized protein
MGGCALDLAFLRQAKAGTFDNPKVYLLEYPGYGGREGRFSEKALNESALAAVDLLHTPGRSLWLVGQSLGSGVACAVVREKPQAVAAVILLTPFRSFFETAASHAPIYPVEWLMRTRFDSAENLQSYPGPVAFFLCQRDSKIPFDQAQRFFQEYAGQKRLWIEPEKDHDASALVLSEWPNVVEWIRAFRSGN